MSLRNIFGRSKNAESVPQRSGMTMPSMGDSQQSVLQLWEKHRRLSPNDPAGFLRPASLLLQMQRVNEAEALLREGASCCPDDITLAIEYATVAQNRGDWLEALDRWQGVTEKFPLHPVACGSSAQALIALERFGEAETQIELVKDHFPDDYFFAVISAVVATKLQNWPLALQRWERVREIKPDSVEASSHLDVIKSIVESTPTPMEIASSEPHAEHSWVPALIERVHDPEMRALMMKFESWGEVCEFGLVQRRFEAEPLSLLRWTNLSVANLAVILEARLEGVGEVENMSLIRDESGEHYLLDKKFGLQFHMWHTEDIPDPEDFTRKHVARIRWLRDKLLDDLTEGGKIFVHKTYYLEPTEADIQRAFAAVNTYGPNRFLIVTHAGECKPAGSLQVDENGLLRAYVTPPRPNVGWDIPFGDWVSICRQVDAL